MTDTFVLENVAKPIHYKVCLDLDVENRLKTYQELPIQVAFVSCIQ